MDGTRSDDTNVVPLALARLERLIEVRLAQSLHQGTEPAVNVRVIDSDLHAPNVAEDPAFYDRVVDRIVETLDHYLADVADGAEQLSADALNDEIEAAFLDAGEPLVGRASDSFVARLRCMTCGIVTVDDAAACETFLRGGARGEVFRVGDQLAFSHDGVAADYYVRAIRAPDQAPVHIIEGWECPHCAAVNWAEIVIRDSLVSSIWSVALSRPMLERAHYLTSECVELAAQMTGRPAWSLMRDDVFEMLFDELEAH